MLNHQHPINDSNSEHSCNAQLVDWQEMNKTRDTLTRNKKPEEDNGTLSNRNDR